VAMKLGPWFNGKNNIIQQTMERHPANRVFPTAVYLDRLDILSAAADKSGDESRAKKSPQEPIYRIFISAETFSDKFSSKNCEKLHPKTTEKNFQRKIWSYFFDLIAPEY
jgi:hypothetical protein